MTEMPTLHEFKERLFGGKEIRGICDMIVEKANQGHPYHLLDVSFALVPEPTELSGLTTKQIAKRNLTGIVKRARKMGLLVEYIWLPTTDEECPMEAPFYVFLA